MKPWIVTTTLILLFIWQFLTLRFGFLPILFLGFLFVLPKIRGAKKSFAALIACGLLYPLNPLEVTAMRVPGPPRVVENCNIRAAGGIDQALEQQQDGHCVMASDIVSEFGRQPTKYVVW